MRTTALLLAGAVALAACGDDDTATSDTTTTTTAAVETDLVIGIGDDDRPPVLDPADTVDVIDNPFFPLAAGDHFVFEGVVDGVEERIVLDVLDERRQVMGIEAFVVRDQAFEDGELVEDTSDWFVQDTDGNVWYVGEESFDIEDGERVLSDGSWESGVDGALPGIIMLADPQVGDVYRQEWYPDHAMDAAEVTEASADRIVTREQNPLEPEGVEDKVYERGVGLVEEIVVRGGEGSVRLVEGP